MHNYHDVRQTFPKNAYGGTDFGWNAWECYNANVMLLPYIEQSALYAQFNQAPAGGWGTYYNGPMKQELKTFLCPSTRKFPNPTVGWGGPGTNYAWCSRREFRAYRLERRRQTQNGMFNDLVENRMADVTDGLSNTIMASEVLSGDADASEVTYPYDIIYVGDGPITAVVNKFWPTQAELNTIRAGAESSLTGHLSNNGSLWAWYAHSQSLFNTAAPLNWQYPSVGGNCCPAAHDWGWGADFPPQLPSRRRERGPRRRFGPLRRQHRRSAHVPTPRRQERRSAGGSALKTRKAHCMTIRTLPFVAAVLLGAAVISGCNQSELPQTKTYQIPMPSALDRARKRCSGSMPEDSRWAAKRRASRNSWTRSARPIRKRRTSSKKVWPTCRSPGPGPPPKPRRCSANFSDGRNNVYKRCRTDW